MHYLSSALVYCSSADIDTVWPPHSMIIAVTNDKCCLVYKPPRAAHRQAFYGLVL